MPLMDRARRFVLEEKGQDLVEYGLLATLIALVVMGALQIAGNNLNTLFLNIANQVKSAA